MYVTFFICLTLWGDGSHENLEKFLLLFPVPSRLLEGGSAGEMAQCYNCIVPGDGKVLLKGKPPQTTESRDFTKSNPLLLSPE